MNYSLGCRGAVGRLPAAPRDSLPGGRAVPRRAGSRLNLLARSRPGTKGGIAGPCAVAAFSRLRRAGHPGRRQRFCRLPAGAPGSVPLPQPRPKRLSGGLAPASPLEEPCPQRIVHGHILSAAMIGPADRRHHLITALLGSSGGPSAPSYDDGPFRKHCYKSANRRGWHGRWYGR